MQLGAYTFIEKTGDFNIDKFLADVRQAINLKIQEEKNISLEEDKEFLRKRFLEQMPLIGESPQVQKVRNLIQKFAKADINALLIGESGTGKEIVANNIYWQSKRAGKPYVAVNAGAFTETLIDSELFGHRKGSFTGAISDKKGYFEQANKGTLFLDEISNLSKSTQAKILRAIEYNEIQIVGGEIKNINVNFIFASNKELDKLVEENQFREDLYYRLEGNTIYIPPLRERGDDIILLIDYFFSRFSQKHESVIDVNLKDIKNTLLSYHWPGNVRELEKFCEYLFVLYDFIDNSIILEEFKKKVQGNLKKQNAALHKLLGIENHSKALDLIEKKYLQYQLSINNGNVSATANKIGLDRSTLYKKIKKYEMD
jgi:two-component system nitrogen regulation response regulator NtrX